MRKYSSIAAACILAVAATTSLQAAPASEPSSTREAITPGDEPIILFDGKTLGDCYVWLKDVGRSDPEQVFRVTDGLLHVTGDGLGSLITNQAFKNYHLVLEYKWGDKTWRDRENSARDTGLLIHSNGVDGGYQGIWKPSIEVQIIEGGVGDFVFVSGKDEAGEQVPLSLTAPVTLDRDGEVVWNPDGNVETYGTANRRRINWRQRDPDWKDEKGFRGPHDVDSPGQQWTRIDVLADGDRITTFVNGVKVNEASNPSPTSGQIQLQTELAEVFFRRWELYPIDGGPAPAPAEQ
ncbi:3-keto-disaccharide hydrolase [Lacipirellula parvula]|nr:DUF1080 domain-containing protein [Lacipirellula parvula]